eukprot:s2117_g2.t1
MFALRSAVILTCLAAAVGRRHIDGLNHLTPMEQAEEKTAEAIESITPHGGDEHLIPLSASFQVAPTMGEMPIKTKMTLLMNHVSTASEPISIVCQLTAKDEASATHFVQTLKDLVEAERQLAGHPLPVTFDFSAPGRQVLIKATGWPKEATQHMVAAVEGLARNLGHVNASVDLDVDMREIMAHLSNDTVLYEEIYKGMRYSVDASLTKALEDLLASWVPGVGWKLFKLFTGASADVKIAFDESVREDLIRSIPFVNMSYGTLVSLYRQIVTQYPAYLRGTDVSLKVLSLILAMETIETLDTLEIKGLPDLQLMAVGNTTSGSFEFLSKLAKDTGLVEAWLPGVVLAAYESATSTEGYDVPAGTVKVSSANGVKWVLPQQIQSIATHGVIGDHGKADATARACSTPKESVCTCKCKAGGA